MKTSHLTKEQAQQIINIIDNTEADTFILGSCQYQSIGTSFLIHQKLIKLLGWETWLKTMEVTLPEEIPTKEQYGIQLKDEIIKQFQDDIKEYPSEDWPQEELNDVIQFYKDNEPTVENYYELTKSLAWDLWSVPILPFNPQPELQKQLELPVNQGPILNMLAWEDNETIGFHIAIANHLWDIDLNTYEGYDT